MVKSYGLFDLTERDSVPTSTAGTTEAPLEDHLRSCYTSYIIDSSHLLVIAYFFYYRVYYREKLWLHIQALVNQGTQ